MDSSYPAAATGQQPWPARGLSFGDFTRIAENGFGDPYNAYPHSMTLFNGKLYVGTTRANLCMLKISKIPTKIKHWPVECPDNLYELDMRAQIHSVDFETGRWSELFRSPMIDGTDGTRVPREMGYRCMAVFQGESDDQPVIYCGTYASVKGQGAQILRSADGAVFDPVPRPEGFEEVITTLRLLIPFKGRLFTSPTGRAGGNPNVSVSTVVYETRDPISQPWIAASEPGFGDPGNVTVFEMLPMGDYLYAGTVNFSGYQVWRTRAEGNPPYVWERVIEQGAWRGPKNQAVASLGVFRNALYVGSGIQHGGIDIANKVGPAGPELIRIHPDGSWDLIVGSPRDTPDGRKEPLSGIGPGFGSVTNGYFWRIASHDGWLYVGTFNWAVMMNYSRSDGWPDFIQRVYGRLGPDEILHNMSGAHLYRSPDGDNWLAVTKSGFDNPYNYGIRSLVSTPHGLVVGTVNPFAPKVGIVEADAVRYEHNPRGGLEIWLGGTERDRAFPGGVELG